MPRLFTDPIIPLSFLKDYSIISNAIQGFNQMTPTIANNEQSAKLVMGHN
jgi:hypothetical protein